MKFINKVVSNLILITLLSSMGSVFAQNREIQDSLIYTDPTVSKSSDYIYGGSLEYWYSHKSINETGYSASATLTQPGINFFVGKDNITASISYRGYGSSSVTFNTVPTTNLGNGEFFETEATIRVLSKQSYISDSVYPYLIGGYQVGHTRTYYGAVSYTSPVVGLGGIIPFNEKFGLRTDFKLLSLKQSSPSVTTGGNIVTGNLYWNLDKDWNAQFGARKTYYASGGYLSYGVNNTSIGYFVMIGKTFK